MDDRSDGLSAGNHSSEMEDMQDAYEEDNGLLEEVNDEDDDGEDLLEHMEGCVCSDMNRSQ
eukprot:9116873-Pyramimonas_sp.AAC.1